MSTNYYIRRIPTVDEVVDSKNRICNAQAKNYRDVLSNELERYDALYEEIHIGKRSCGWRFLWELWGNKYYDCSIASIKEFLNKKISEGWVLENEYGEAFSVDEFFNEIDSWLHTGQYGTEDDSKYSYMYKVVCDPEIHENLRFSYSEDFR